MQTKSYAVYHVAQMLTYRKDGTWGADHTKAATFNHSDAKAIADRTGGCKVIVVK